MAKRKGGKRRKKVTLAPEHKSKRATSARQIITHTKVSGGKGAIGTRMARVEKKVDALGVVVHEHDQELDAQRTFLASMGNTVNRALGGGAAANPEENPYRGALGSGKKKGKKRRKKSKKAKSGSAPKKRRTKGKRRSSKKGGKRRARKGGKRRSSKRRAKR